MQKQSGFTLIELSIVLVIIGLIIGGILLGRDLIAASQARAQIAQIEKYNSAVNAFHNKYGGIPGDLSLLLVAQFGFTQGVGCGGSAAYRDGNGIIEGYTGLPLDQGRGETLMFWGDLSTAGLIDGTYPNSGASGLNCSTGLALSLTPGTSYIGDYFPPAKIGFGNFVYVYGVNGVNWFNISAVTSTATDGQMFSSPTIPNVMAYNIDKKMDDGLPVSGSVIAVYENSGTVSPVTAPTGPTDSATTCYSGTGTSYAYSLSASANGGNLPNCALAFKFQ